MPVTESPVALVEIEEVKDFLNIDASDEENDDTLQRLINQASATIIREAGREFVKDERYGDAREIPLETRPYAQQSWEPYRVRIPDLGGDEADISLIRMLDTWTGTSLVSYNATPSGWRLWPRGEIVKTHLSLVGYAPGQSLEITTEKWGFPEIPDDIIFAAKVTVSEWYARDVERFSRVFSIDQGHVIRPQVLPDAVRDTVYAYRIVGV
jgi:hypothetical protein